MKALLISSATRTIKEIDVPSPFHAYKKMIGGGMVEEVYLSPQHVLRVDEYGRDHEATKAGFRICGTNVVGDGVLCGLVDGYDTPCRFSVEDIAAQIEWYEVGGVPPVQMKFFSTHDPEEFFAMMASNRRPPLRHVEAKI